MRSKLFNFSLLNFEGSIQYVSKDFNIFLCLGLILHKCNVFSICIHSSTVFAVPCIGHTVLTKPGWATVVLGQTTLPQAMDCWLKTEYRRQPTQAVTVQPVGPVKLIFYHNWWWNMIYFQKR